eukprot:TRINITY_DN1534_c0_g1_i1.p1 TRINITY_DN1534_c0_g1~~TRINITY_DN1534_c0_g1_i1.p1  ORF type:complete len:464 (-),score=128.21 TRINITY_DN1534_c0_g1_i1:80-1471(-)
MERTEGDSEPKGGPTFDEMVETVQQTEEWKHFFESFVSSLPKTSAQGEQEVSQTGENIDIVDEEWAKNPSKCIDHMDVFISEKSEDLNPVSALLEEKITEATGSIGSWELLCSISGSVARDQWLKQLQQHFCGQPLPKKARRLLWPAYLGYESPTSLTPDPISKAEEKLAKQQLSASWTVGGMKKKPAEDVWQLLTRILIPSSYIHDVIASGACGDDDITSQIESTMDLSVRVSLSIPFLGLAMGEEVDILGEENAKKPVKKRKVTPEQSARLNRAEKAIASWAQLFAKQVMLSMRGQDAVISAALNELGMIHDDDSSPNMTDAIRSNLKKMWNRCFVGWMNFNAMFMFVDHLLLSSWSGMKNIIKSISKCILPELLKLKKAPAVDAFFEKKVKTILDSRMDAILASMDEYGWANVKTPWKISSERSVPLQLPPPSSPSLPDGHHEKEPEKKRKKKSSKHVKK